MIYQCNSTLNLHSLGMVNLWVVEALLSKEGLALYNIPMFFALFFSKFYFCALPMLRVGSNKTLWYMIDSFHFMVIDYKFW